MARPRRMAVLGATPTALPTNLRTDEPRVDERGIRERESDGSSGKAPEPVTEPSTNGNGHHPAAAESDGSGSTRRFGPDSAAIPQQRQAEPEVPAARTDVEDVTAPQTDKAVEERPAPTYVDQRPPPTHGDQRPAARYVDDRPAPSYVDERPAPRYVDERTAASYVDEPKPKPGTGGTGDQEGTEPVGGFRGAWAKRPTSIQLSWKSLGAILLTIVVVFWVAKGFVGGSTTQQTSPSASAGQKVAVPKAKTHPKPVLLDGSAIRAAGALITLNPALAQPGASLTVSGSGFDPRSTVEVVLSSKGSSTGTSLGSFKTDRTGNLNAQVTVPDSLQSGSVTVTAKEWNSSNVATAEATTAAGMGFARLNKTTGKPGDTVAVTARGFAPGEKIKVYWGRASGTPTSTLQASSSGTVSQAPIRVGVGQVGDATLVLVGAKSGTTATVPFYMLGLYPTATATPYALKAGEQLNVSASGFAPDERVLIYINTSSGPPALTATSDTQGNIGGLGFKVPFGLKGAQSIVMVGQQSRASVSSGFQVLPYTPSAQTSTYGGSPGTSLSFFAKDFAPNEVVLVYLGRTKYSAGELVGAFRVDDQGAAGAAGSFQITSGDQGTLTFTLVGRKSGGSATASVKVTPANGPVNLPPRPQYTLPPSLRR